MKLIDKLLNKTKDGFVKENVVIARTGSMDYLGSELGMGLKPNDLHQVYVTPEELFSQDTIDSIEGVDVTFIHPDALEITIDDWKKLAVGHVQNIYQDGEFLKGTIFVKDKSIIDEIEKNGIEEVSLGYDSDIIEKDGKLIKTNIRANHLAIVPEGRCGSACKIGDSKQKVKQMALKPKKRLPLADSIARMLGAKTSGEKAVARKFGDTRKKIADAKVKLGDSVRQKLADLEQVLQNPEATDADKQAALEGVSTIADEIAQAVEILDGAKDSVDETENAVENIPVADATLPEGVSIPEELAGYVAELETERDDAIAKADELQGQLDTANAEIESLKAELEKLKGESSATTAVADAKARFPKMKLADSYKSQREVRQTVLIQKGIYTDAAAVKLSDCEINSAYQALTVHDSKPVLTVGKKLTDSTGKAVNRASQLGGKK